MLDAGFELTLRLGSVRRTQAWREAPVTSKVQEHRAPHHLTAIANAGPHGLHAVVQDLFRHSTELAKCFLMHPQKRAELLVQRCFRHHHPAIAEREREARQSVFLAIYL